MDYTKAWVIDIETNNLLSKSLDYSSFPYKLNKDAKLWCIVLRNIVTDEVVYAEKEHCTKEWIKEVLKDCTHLIAHNGIKFDFPMLRLFDVMDYEIGYLDKPDLLFGRKIIFIDTLINSRISFPDRFGGHSLESWGERIGEFKTDYRQACIAKGIISKTDKEGTEFQVYSEIMRDYCIQDTKTNRKTFLKLDKELQPFSVWEQSIKQENKLADLAVNRESLGFFFNKELAVECLSDLQEKMETLANNVEPILPEKPMNKGELSVWTPPKRQTSKTGELTSAMLNFLTKTNALYEEKTDGTLWYIMEDGVEFKLPLKDEPLKTHQKAKITDLDHVKMHLISLGWKPTEWRERDLTKDAKKQPISYDKRIKALERWAEETANGKYKEARLEKIGLKEECLLPKWINRLKEDLKKERPVKVPTSPCVRVGVEKNLCPNLESLGEEVAFAKDFTLYLTYKHRKSAIAGGEIEDMDFDNEVPNTGYLSMYREEDGRVSTPAIEIGAASHRYRHIGVANVPRASSVYGKEMRSLFGCGNNASQLGFDFSSLEARIMGHYVWKYAGGQEMAQMFLADKPNDWHTVTSVALGISRTDTKSLNYAAIYGAQPKKISQMLSVELEKGEEILNGVWDNAPALKSLKIDLENFWEKTGREYIIGIDGRRIKVRSKHSILNTLFQSAGIICAKYVQTFLMEEIEHQGLCISPFVSVPDVCSMIEYHDEAQLFINNKFTRYVDFENEEEAKEYLKIKDEQQPSTISLIDDVPKVYLPNLVSIGISDAIKKTEKLLNLNVPLGFEWCIGKNWFECH